MEKVFLIGGSGFVGKNLARYLSRKYEVHVYDKYIDEIYFSGLPCVKTIKMDLISEQISWEIESPDYIINLASIVTAERDLSLFDELISSNLKILLNLFERFKKEDRLKLFIQFGSSEEYGSKLSPFEEDSRESPNSPYALVKQLTTNTTLMLYRNYSFPSMVVRPGNLFGPLQNISKFIPYVVDSLKSNNVLNVSPCEQKRDFIYVDDFAYAIELILLKNKKCIGEILNVSSGNSLSLKEIINICKEYMGSTSIINYGALPYRENEAMDLKCSMNKFFRLIGHVEFDNKKRLIEYITSL